MTVDDMVEIGMFDWKQSAYRWLRNQGMEPKGYIRTGGRPKGLYFDGRLAGPPKHEHDLTLFLLKYSYPMVRGQEVDRKLRPDATMWVGGEAKHIELDTGAEVVQRVRRQLHAYKKLNEWVLVVCLSAGRAESLYKRFEGDYTGMCFGVLDDALKTPYGRIWRGWDEDGERKMWRLKPVEEAVEEVVSNSSSKTRK